MTQKALLQSAGDGTAVPQGYVGEEKQTILGVNFSLTTSLSDVMTLSLDTGVWLIGYRVCVYVVNQGASAITNSVNVVLTNNSNAEIAGTGGQLIIEFQPASGNVGVVSYIQAEVPITVNSTQTYKLRGIKAAGVTSSNGILHDGSYRFSRMYARRIA